MDLYGILAIVLTAAIATPIAIVMWVSCVDSIINIIQKRKLEKHLNTTLKRQLREDFMNNNKEGE